MQEFWNWTWDQHAQYDLPAQLRFISTETDKPVHFIGASQVSFEAHFKTWNNVRLRTLTNCVNPQTPILPVVYNLWQPWRSSGLRCWTIFNWLIMAVLQAATVGAAAATDKETAHMLRSLTLIGPTVFRGNSNSFLLNAWAYFFGVTLDTVWTSLQRMLL